MRIAYRHARVFPVPWRSPVRRALHDAGVDILDVVGPDGAGAAPPVVTAEPPVEVWLSEGVGRGAEDETGVRASSRLEIPYVLVEPGLDPGGESRTLDDASAIITSHRGHFVDLEARRDLRATIHGLRPLVDLAEIQSALHGRDASRAWLATKLQLPTDVPWLVVDGRADGADALRSYAVLARAMSRLVLEEWRLVVAADGSRFDEVVGALRGLPADRVRLWRSPAPDERLRLHVCADVFLWPALGHTGIHGMLEAQAAGVPVVSSRTPAAADRVIDGATGRLTEPGNAEAFSQAIAFLLRHPQFRATYAKDARAAAAEHHLTFAGRDLARILEGIRAVPGR